jgi:hypothetical protein
MADPFIGTIQRYSHDARKHEHTTSTVTAGTLADQPVNGRRGIRREGDETPT